MIKRYTVAKQMNKGETRITRNAKESDRNPIQLQGIWLCNEKNVNGKAQRKCLT